MKIVTWNVNSLRSLGRPLKQVLDGLDADVICVQETKLRRSGLEEELAMPEGYEAIFAFSTSVYGYSGVGTFVSKKRSPFAVPVDGGAGLLGQVGGRQPSSRGDQGYGCRRTSCYH
mmetsp:Transcript_5319/g.15883  ORF Transcript_5319/g.15883 Transcript_5319/m.15883 type:complete len:116 (+) Transcript_5319:55-402(+)